MVTLLYLFGRKLCSDFLDSVGGGAWPFLVCGAISLVNSHNERDYDMLTSKIGQLMDEKNMVFEFHILKKFFIVLCMFYQTLQGSCWIDSNWKKSTHALNWVCLDAVALSLPRMTVILLALMTQTSSS